MTDELRDLLDALARGELSTDQTIDRLRARRHGPVGDFAVVDHDRAARCGFPEVIYCEGKQPEQVAAIVTEILRRAPRVLMTRADEAHAAAVTAEWPDARHHHRARCLSIDPTPLPREGLVSVVAAGTADLPVADEARVTLEITGAEVEMICDVGVAGLQRLLDRLPEIRRARVVVAVAGMEGALPSGRSAGLVDRARDRGPDVSVGYGAGRSAACPPLLGDAQLVRVRRRRSSTSTTASARAIVAGHDQPSPGHT